MKVPYNWLKSYIDFPYNPDELAEILTISGMEVDSIDYMGEGLTDIVVGEIIKIIKHPNADKLVICDVNIGKEVLKIVTGASNVFESAKVPVATVGAVLPNGLSIKPVKLRGEASYGMLCSTDELGLSDKRAAGIMILSEDAQPGMKLVDYLGLDEYVLELDLTPNYARCLGLLGIAQELKVLLPDKELKYPENKVEESGEKNIYDYIKIDVKDEDLCPRYTGRLIKDIKLGPSPDWMQKRLKEAGIRPINNVVDITNYVLLEYNQPLHAFDYDTISGKELIIRRAKDKEKIMTLDDKEHNLDKEILVIADKDRAIALAGVMGGANTEVTDQTKNIFLESAYFNPVNIRKAAKKMGFASESSYRFERGVDIEKVVEASNRAAYLMQKYTGGTVVEGIADLYPHPYKPLEIKLELVQVNKILRLQLTITEIKEILEKLQFNILQVEDDYLLVAIPAFRNDVEREADLIEEIARIYGYNNIPVTNPTSKQQGRKTAKQSLEDLTKEVMTASGLDEVINFSLTSKEIFDSLNIPAESRLRQYVKIKNPLNEAYAVMRTALIPGILKTLANNAKRQIETMAVFELGNVFYSQGVKKSPLERLKIAGGSMGCLEDSWGSGAPDFFYLKGILESYFARLGVKNISFVPAEVSYLHPGRTAKILSGQRELGIIGEVLPNLCAELDLKERTTVFELSFNEIVELVDLNIEYRQLPKYPSVERDLAILVDKKIEAGDILSSIKNKGGDLIKDAAIFDLYEGEQIPREKKSIAFKLLFQSEERTLRDEEVNKLFEQILKYLGREFKAVIRK